MNEWKERDELPEARYKGKLRAWIVPGFFRFGHETLYLWCWLKSLLKLKQKEHRPLGAYILR
jgi:hypothetical protein